MRDKKKRGNEVDQWCGGNEVVWERNKGKNKMVEGEENEMVGETRGENVVVGGKEKKVVRGEQTKVKMKWCRENEMVGEENEEMQWWAESKEKKSGVRKETNEKTEAGVGSGGENDMVGEETKEK